MWNTADQNSWTPVLSCPVLAQVLADRASSQHAAMAGAEDVLPPGGSALSGHLRVLRSEAHQKSLGIKCQNLGVCPSPLCDSPCLQCPHCLLLRVTLVNQLPRWRHCRMRDVSIGGEGWWPSVQGQKIWIHWKKRDTFQHSWKEEKRQARQVVNVWWRLKAINKRGGGTSFCRWVLRSLCAHVERKTLRCVELQDAHTF